MTDTLTPNLPELKRLNMWVQEQDKLEPGARIWFQNSWIELREQTPMCQTAYCIAGMAVVRAGHEFRLGADHSYMLDGKMIRGDTIPRLSDEILGIQHRLGDYYGEYEEDEYDDSGDIDDPDFDLYRDDNTAEDIDRIIRRIFQRAGADYDAVEPAPDLEIEIKAAEAVRPQLLPTLTNA